MSSIAVLSSVACLLVGLGLGFLLARARFRARLAGVEQAHKHAVAMLERDAESALEVHRERISAERNALETSLKAMEDRFKSLAAGVLEKNSETFRKEFLELANQNFEVSQQRATKDLDKRRSDIEKMLDPMKQTLSRLETGHKELEKKRAGAYGDLKAHLEALKNETQALRDSSVYLSTALRGSSQARGQWGQISLRNLVESAGMLEHCDFTEEKTLQGPDGIGRADMVVRLPGGGGIPIDAKVPLAAYWDALQATDPVERKKLMAKHAKDVVAHVRELARRDYSGQISEGVDFTVMFLPAEPILAAAFEQDPDLQEMAYSRRVLVTTPVTLLALLRTVGIYWQQQSMAENAAEIFEVAKVLYERIAKFGGDLGKMGRGLSTALGAYNDAVASYDARVVPAGKKLEDLKVTTATKRTLETLPEIEGTPRGPRPLSLEEPPPEAPTDPPQEPLH
jgi:DNA recombination protein RmuC